MKKLKLLISVWGRSKIGKTSTLKELAKILDTKGNCKYLKGSFKNKKGDFEAVFSYGKMTIAIVSKGDPPGRDIKSSLLRIIADYRPNVIVCASRTHGDTVKAVRGIANTAKANLVWTSPYESDKKLNNFIDLNSLKAKHILSFIEEVKSTRLII